MSRLPRLLPLAAIAVVGVLALNAIAGARGLPELISNARAWAEDIVPAKGNPKADPKAPVAKPGPLPPEKAPVDLTPVAAVGAPVCAPAAADLAKGLGVSNEELKTFQSLSARRDQLDQRERDLDMAQQLLAVADRKSAENLAAIRSSIETYKALLEQVDVKQQEALARQVQLIEGMKPKEAAATLAGMSDDKRLPIASKMKVRALASVMNVMPIKERIKLVEGLQDRYGQTAPVVAGDAKAAPPAGKAAPAQAAAPAKKTG